MKETLAYLRQQFIEAKDVAKLQWKSFLIATILMLVLYMCSIYVAPGWISWMAIVPPSFITAITALARVNDIGPERMSKRWQARKVGLILAGAGSVMLMATPFFDNPAFPTWRVVVIMWGFALTWLTTPDHPPWDYYITGKYRLHNPEVPRSPLHRVIGRITGQHSVEELRRRAAEHEQSKTKRRDDGAGP